MALDLSDLDHLDTARSDWRTDLEEWVEADPDRFLSGAVKTCLIVVLLCLLVVVLL